MKKETDMIKRQVQDVLIARIKELCKEKGISYYTLSYKATIPMSTLVHIIEGSTQNPGILTIMKICDGLGVSMKEFFDTPEFDDVINDCD